MRKPGLGDEPDYVAPTVGVTPTVNPTGVGQKPNSRDLERIRKRDVLNRELLLVAVLSRVWPAHLAPPRKPQQMFPFIVCLHSPAGHLVWRVSEEELSLFDHLERRANDAKDYTAGDKMALLLLLATEGWTA